MYDEKILYDYIFFCLSGDVNRVMQSYVTYRYVSD